MKLVRLSTAYADYLKYFFENHKGLENECFARQHETLMYDGFGWADFFRNALEPLGYNVEEIVANAEPIQRVWARENGLSQPGRDWLLRLAADRVKAAAPDILFISDYTTFSRAWIEDLRTKCPSIRMVLGWCGAPFQDSTVFSGYDVVLSCVPELVEMFRGMGHKSYHLNHAFDKRILDRIDAPGERRYDFTFVGQIHRQAGFHRERENILLNLVDHTPLIIFSMSSCIGPGKYIMSFLRKGIHSIHSGLLRVGLQEKLLDRIPIVSRGIRYRDNPLLPVHPGLKKHLTAPCFGLEMFRVLRDSKVTFNSHLNISVHSSSNMRMFETTGVGTCLLTDHMEKTSELFVPDKEVVTYRSAEECIEKVVYLLEHPSERNAIARAGQIRTLREHSFHVRAQVLDGIIKGWFKNIPESTKKNP